MTVQRIKQELMNLCDEYEHDSVKVLCGKVSEYISNEFKTLQQNVTPEEVLELTLDEVISRMCLCCDSHVFELMDMSTADAIKADIIDLGDILDITVLDVYVNYNGTTTDVIIDILFDDAQHTINHTIV